MILQRRQPTLVAAHRPQPEWLDDFADAARATDLLVHHLKRDRIPAVVRRSAPNLAGRSLLEMLAAGETSQLLEAVRAMFDFERVDRARPGPGRPYEPEDVRPG